MSEIGDIPDECFTRTTQFVAELSQLFEEEIGAKPTVKELCEILCWGIRSCGVDILKDINVENLVALEAKVQRRRKTLLTPGDVLAIPLPNGDCFLGVFLGRFRRQGDALGLLAERHPCGPFAPGAAPNLLPRPIFFHRQGVTSGRWKIVASRPEWIRLFPDPLEYYHAKQFHPHNERIGPFGSAEQVVQMSAPPSASPPLRSLSEAEARQIGLLDAGFFQSGLMEEVEAYVQHLSSSAQETQTRR